MSLSTSRLLQLAFLVAVGVATAVIGFSATRASAQTPVVLRVLSDRTPSHLEPLFARYTEATGVEIEAVHVDDGLLARLEARPTEADIIITSTADILEKAAGSDLLAPLPKTSLSAVKDVLRFEASPYAIMSYRARGFYVSQDRVAHGEIATYDDLTDEKWRGRVCIRSGYHRYNVSLFAQMASDRGLEWTEGFLRGLKANLARAPKGNDRAQVRAIYDSICDVSIGNSYYMPIMHGSEEQRPWAEATRVVFPDQNGAGAYVMTGGIALTRADRAGQAAVDFVDFALGEYGQTYIANLTFEYPVRDDIALPEVLQEVGADQPELTERPFRANVVALQDIDAMRGAVLQLLDDIDFDRP